MGGNNRNGTVTQSQIFLLILMIFFGSMMFLLNSTIKTEDITSEISTFKSADIISDISSSKLSITQERERIMINLEFGKSAPKMDIIKNTEDTTECDFKRYIFGVPVSQDDPCLIAAVKENYVIKPSPKDTSDPSSELVIKKELPANKEKFEWVKKLLVENSKGGQGFFIECGANDGSFISPTIRLENTFNWTGLLIEANPIPFKKLLEKKRNAYAVNAALCIGENPQPIEFFTNPGMTGVSGIHRRHGIGAVVKTTVQCIPFYSVLKALDLKVVDYLSLDVEGLELDILKTLPFGKDATNGEEIIFKVMTVEHWSVPGGSDALRKFLEPKGYKFIKTLVDRSTNDSLFVHHSLYGKAKGIKLPII